MAFLDETGLKYFWIKLKNLFLPVTGGTMNGKLSVPSLNLGGSDVADFVLDQGTSDIWYYRKWSSGRMEAYALVECIWKGFPQALYQDVTFPAEVKFTQIYIITCGLPHTSINSEETFGYNTRATSSNPSGMTAIVYSPSKNFASGSKLSVGCHVLGRWK